MQLNDYELLYYCYQSNEESFDLLFKKYENYIFYMINLFKKNYYFFSYEDVDLKNEGLILLYECIYSFREEFNVKFSSYFLACLKRKYLYIIRTLASNKNRSHALAMSLDAPLSEANNDLYTIIAYEGLGVAEQVNNSYEVEVTLTKMKKKLSEIEKSIIYYYLKGYSYEDITNLLTINHKKIDNTVQKYKRIVKSNFS